MKLETLITNAWQRKALWLWLLLPISGLYGLLTAVRRKAYQLGWLASYRAPVPVMVIGNITVGGSGKTPLIISLVHYLQQRGIKVGVISRGYGGDSTQMPALVTTDSLPSAVGDEPCLIVNITGVAMAVCPNRKQAITTLLEAHKDIQLIIADDGLQHYALQRDIEWIVVDAARGFGNRQLLPVGYLREPLSRLKDSTVIYHKKLDAPVLSGSLQATNELIMHLQPSPLKRLLAHNASESSADSISQLTAPKLGSTVHGVSGIGYPQRFFDTLRTLGFEVVQHPYPDHYDFSLAELLQYIEYPIVVTSKDAVKIKALWRQKRQRVASSEEAKSSHDWDELAARLWVLPVSAELSKACYQTLEQQLKALGINTALIDNATCAATHNATIH
ncbi:tetraacyldisaccharide 4'-kinase [Psychrobacter sp. 2Y5]|uniref:tetraacyldisaccharide 4'-kinase n=1 Tax=unclassified Psychrobacter TaxID=196806 RepID=UPI003F44E85B